MNTILLVDDDVQFCESIQSTLIKYGYELLVSHNSDDAESKIQNEKIDLILLNWILQGPKDGMTLCKNIREKSNIPIVILTGIEEEVDRIVSLEMGADYYLTKPFNTRVLIAHIRALLRRSLNTSLYAIVRDVEYDVYEFVGWKLNITTRTVLSAHKKIIKMTSAEFTLLQTLLMHPQRVLTRDQLLDFTHNESTPFDRSVDILMSRLRAKIEKNNTPVKIFTTIRNTGYLLSCKVHRIKMPASDWESLLPSEIVA